MKNEPRSQVKMPVERVRLAAPSAASRDCGPICVDNRNTKAHYSGVKTQTAIAEVNIHLRARTQDRVLIDQAAELVGANRSQFMLASAIKEAKNILLDQSTIYADAKTFQKVMDWMDSPATRSETAGMKRILQAKTPWQSE